MRNAFWRLAVLLLLILSLEDSRSRVSCSRAALTCEECNLIADSLHQALHEDSLSGTAQSDGEVAGTPRLRRHLIHGRSEPAIFKAIDSVCDQVLSTSAATRNVHKAGDSFRKICTKLMQDNRSDLENRIFDSGAANLRHVLCMELSGLCYASELRLQLRLHDSGEL